MSATISVRVSEEIKKEIEELGYKPGEYLKMILENELQRERSHGEKNTNPTGEYCTIIGVH